MIIAAIMITVILVITGMVIVIAIVVLVIVIVILLFNHSYYSLGFRARGYHVLFDRSRLPCPLGPLGVHDELVATVAEAQGILAGFL